MIKELISHCSKEQNSPVAQSVEQVAVNHPVGGSNPSGGAKESFCNPEAFFIVRYAMEPSFFMRVSFIRKGARNEHPSVYLLVLYSLGTGSWPSQMILLKCLGSVFPSVLIMNTIEFLSRPSSCLSSSAPFSVITE